MHQPSHHGKTDSEHRENGVVDRPAVSVYIITLNEEEMIGRVLDSVRWADEIIVVDSGSRDRTVDICREAGARVVHRDLDSFVTQKNFALNLCRGEWALNIDADEEVSEVLAASLRDLVGGNRQKSADVFRINRRTWYLGRWIRHCGWYPEYRVRLSRMGMAAWKGSVLHEYLEPLNGVDTGVLSGDLLHRPYRNVSHHVTKIARYADMWAERELSAGRRPGVWDILVHPAGRFVKMYIVKRGFLDGVPGLIVSMLGAVYTFLKYARLWEKSGRQND